MLPRIAAIARPNALDRRVDARFSTSELMTQPATALVDPDRQVAHRRVHWSLFGWVMIELFEAAALFYLWSSGGAAALRDWLRRRVRSERNVRFLFGAAPPALVARVAALAPAFYMFRVERTLELTAELTRTWALLGISYAAWDASWPGSSRPSCCGSRSERTSGTSATMAAAAVSVGWLWFAYPSSGAGGASSLRPARAPLDALLRRAGLPKVAVVESGDDSPLGRVAVLRSGPNPRVVLTHSLVAGHTEPEIEYRIAYELGHIAHNDLLSIALIEGGIVIVFSAIAIVIADRVRFRRDDDHSLAWRSSVRSSRSSTSRRSRCAMPRCAPTTSTRTAMP